MNHRGPLAKLVGGSIGLAQEYKHDREERKKAAEGPASGTSGASTAAPEGLNSHLSDEESDDEEWALNLDQAQQEIAPEEAGQNESEDVDQIINKFVAKHAPPPHSNQRQDGNLALPVILPQRRPESRHRGFVRAYAPILQDCNIDQETWLEFLDGFEKSIKQNPWFHVANVAVWVAGKVEMVIAGVSVIAIAVTLAIHLSVEGGRRTYIHYKQNKYLDRMNAEFFKPRGLYCLVVKYKPSSNEPVETIDINRNVTEAVASRDGEDWSKWKNLTSSSSSTTKHEEEIPEAAPLIFPDLDNMNTAQKENAVKHFGHFVGDYMDRRGQAKFDAAHPDSKLGGVPQQDFASRYSDPNHPASTGGMISIATGGKYNPPSPLDRLRNRHSDRRQRMGLGASRLGKENRQQRKQNKPLRKLLKQDAIYLMVVNLPTEEEMQAVLKAVETTK